LFSAYKFKTKVKPDEDRKFDPVFYNKAFKQYQAELLFASEDHTDQDFMQNAHNFMPFDEVLELQANCVRSAREAYLFKTIINNTQSDATNFAGKLKGTTWEFPSDFETKVFEELQKNHNNPIENSVATMADKLKILLTQRKWDTWNKFQQKLKEDQAKQTVDAAMKYQDKDRIDKEEEGESWKPNPERIVNKADIIKELTKSRKVAVEERRARLTAARLEKVEQIQRQVMVNARRARREKLEAVREQFQKEYDGEVVIRSSDEVMTGIYEEIIDDLSDKVSAYNVKNFHPKTVVKQTLIRNEKGRVQNVIDYVYTDDDGLLPPPPPTSIVAENIIPDVNTVVWSKTLNMDAVNQEFEDFNPDAFYQFLKNKYQDKWPDALDDPSYRIDDMWKLSTGTTPMYANGTVSNIVNVNTFSNIKNQRSSNSTIYDSYGFSWDESDTGPENLNQTNSNPYVDVDNGGPN
jgi:hypothetical protein